MESRSIVGTAVRYGDEASLYNSKEVVNPGAFKWKDVILNRQHNRQIPLARTGSNLEIIDSPEKLEVRAALPNTTDANDTLELISKGILTGLSVGMRVVEDRWDNGVRTILHAVLDHISIVDTPAYGESKLSIREKGKKIKIWL